MASFFAIFCFENVPKQPIVIVFLNITQNFLIKGSPQNANFSQFWKHRWIKQKTFCCNPSWPKIGVFQLVFFETNNIDVEKT